LAAGPGPALGHDAPREPSPVAPATLSDEAFLHYLPAAPTVPVDEGIRAVLLLDSEGHSFRTFDERWAELRRRGAVRDDWDLRAGDTLDVGTLAFMLRSLTGVRGGLTNVVSEATGLGERRYALRACVDAGLLPPSRSRQPVIGGVLIAALTKSESSMRSPGP
jgi:hypothetical protein